jgi:hypothetical protein
MSSVWVKTKVCLATSGLCIGQLSNLIVRRIALFNDTFG